jgi:hypothetical protein
VIGRESHVFVEVKHLDARPIDIRLVRQRVEECDLRHAGRGDDSGLAERGKGITQT